MLDGRIWRSFGGRGYEATSLDQLAAELGIRKQTILYYYPSKAELLDAVIDRSAAELAAALEDALADAGRGLGPGRGHRPLGVPPGPAPARAARPAPRGQPARARRRPPG